MNFDAHLAMIEAETNRQEALTIEFDLLYPDWREQSVEPERRTHVDYWSVM